MGDSVRGRVRGVCGRCGSPTPCSDPSTCKDLRDVQDIARRAQQPGFDREAFIREVNGKKR